jgi:hypothetical protein
LFCEGDGAKGEHACVPLTEIVPVKGGLANGAFRFNAV